MIDTKEPFIGDELISIMMTTFAIEFHFSRDVLQVGGLFTLSRPCHVDEQFEPEKKLGTLGALWPLIGRVVTSTQWGPDWGDTVEIVFDNAALIRILPVSDGFRGTIRRNFPLPGSLAFEDF